MDLGNGKLVALIWTEPRECDSCRPEDLLHQAHLIISFRGVVLVQTDGVGLEVPVGESPVLCHHAHLAVSEEELVQVGRDLNRTSANHDEMSYVGSSQT